MAIIPFSIKAIETKRSEQDKDVLMSKIVKQVVKELQIQTPTTVHGDFGIQVGNSDSN